LGATGRGASDRAVLVWAGKSLIEGGSVSRGFADCRFVRDGGLWSELWYATREFGARYLVVVKSKRRGGNVGARGYLYAIPLDATDTPEVVDRVRHRPLDPPQT
jgi:hypothetical protein